MIRKHFVWGLVFLAFTSCKKDKVTPTGTPYDPGTGWTKVWSEEFDSTALNTNIWNYDTGGGGWGNQELQYYREENISFKDGSLIIKAKRENFGGREFTSSRINSRDKYKFKYGKIAGRIKMPEGYGIWPAFWMLGNTVTAWPGCGEIDIMEMRGDVSGGNGNKTTMSTCHWRNASNNHQYYGLSYLTPSNLSAGYHIYEVEWNASKIIARFDGHQYFEMSITAPEVNELKDNEFFIVLNVAVGGTFFSPALTSPANVTASFPQTMAVDWIRVYQ